MFSHVINNPNKFVIKKNDYYVIPFGHRCTSAVVCKYANIRKFSLPFDWNTPLFPSKIQKVLENNFEDFIPDVHNGIFYNKYGFELAHFNPNINDGIEEYKRRIDRFNDVIMKGKKIYFVYFNEDYIWDSNYREDEFNDRMFNEMLELEKFLRNKYIGIDYNILYFNFKHNKIPKTSNIINIILHSTTLDNFEYDLEILRKYSAEILAELFQTKLSLESYDFYT
jgi:hypothetical protein